MQGTGNYYCQRCKKTKPISEFNDAIQCKECDKMGKSEGQCHRRGCYYDLPEGEEYSFRIQPDFYEKLNQAHFCSKECMIKALTETGYEREL